MTTTARDVAALLRALPDTSGWQVVESHHRSTQRYTVFERDEALREVASTKLTATVHVRQAREGKETLGESSVTFSPQADATEVRALLQATLERARLVHNEPYTLPGPGEDAPPVTTADEAVVENARAVVDTITHSIRSAAAEHAGVTLSSSEVFADDVHQRVLNSRGLDVERRETDLLVEYVLLARDAQGDEHEIWQSPKARLAADLDVAGHIRRYVQYTRDGLSAVLPTSGTYDVLFGEEALDTLWDYFVGQAHAAARYEGWSRLKPGEPVVADLRGEPLTLHSDPTLPGGRASQARDAQGQPCRKVTLVQDNVFRAFVATKKYADLTGVPATGPMGNVVVTAGPTPYAKLLQADRPVYELLRFSQLSPNPISGAFSGEIRTGYLHQDGRVTPVRGGSVSGNILQAFAEARFAQEIVRRESYLGPRGVRLGQVAVTG
ncbi:MAG: hypothetical protein HY904_25615 [Deltaproteobacteria bacterium]|nr:hypothetical protein [Deltaproteobacteria bacterium]